MVTVPNALTALRIILIVPFVYLVGEGSYLFALGAFFLASITDVLDGYLARKLNQQSSLGRFLDPLADKMLITAAYVVMAIPHRSLPSIPVWLAALVVGRDLFILLGSAVIYLAVKYTGFRPSIFGKINTFIELGLIVYWLSVNAVEWLSPVRGLKPLCYGVVALSVVVSGCDYTWKGINILRTGESKPPNPNSRLSGAKE